MKIRHTVCVSLAAVTLIGGAAFPARVAASPESRALIEQGAEDLRARKFDDAFRKFNTAAQADPADAEAAFFQGVALNRLDRFDEALARLEKARSMGAINPELDFELGWSLLGLGRHREAAAEWGRARRLASPELGALTRALIEEGVEDLRARKFDDAFRKFSTVAQADPADAEAAFFQGVALNRLGRGAEALPKLADAQRRGLKRVDLHLEIGYAHVQMRDWANALTRLQRYEVLEPGKGITQELLGSAYFGSGNLEEAKKAFVLAAQRDPALKPTSELYLARIAARQGNRQEANDRVPGISGQTMRLPEGLSEQWEQGSQAPGR